MEVVISQNGVQLVVEGVISTQTIKHTAVGYVDVGECLQSEGIDKGKGRFREMNIFRYWFRAVERYAPWVNKVFLVTNGKFPDWINPDNPKLVLVKHEDYIPEEYLPTFNSCTIELHLHRIKDLSEHFVYFNDDIMLNGLVSPDYFFKNELPCDLLIRNLLHYLSWVDD